MDGELTVAGYNESIGLDTNGEGFSIGIFFSGCNKTPKCEKCHNPSLWVEDPSLKCHISDIIRDLKTHGELFTHVVLMGGEPLDQHHGNLLHLIRHLQNEGYIVWMYTGWERDEIPPTFLISLDVIIAGPFKPHLRTNSFPPSSNQVIVRRE